MRADAAALARAGLALGSALTASQAVGADLGLDVARLAPAAGRYQDPARLPAHPVPVVVARRAGLAAGPQEMAEIREKILYPLLVRSPKAVAAIVLEWYSGQPNVLGVIVVWADGDTRESLVPRTVEGRYGPTAYEVLLAKPTP